MSRPVTAFRQVRTRVAHFPTASFQTSRFPMARVSWQSGPPFSMSPPIQQATPAATTRAPMSFSTRPVPGTLEAQPAPSSEFAVPSSADGWHRAVSPLPSAFNSQNAVNPVAYRATGNNFSQVTSSGWNSEAPAAPVVDTTSVPRTIRLSPGGQNARVAVDPSREYVAEQSEVLPVGTPRPERTSHAAGGSAQDQPQRQAGRRPSDADSAGDPRRNGRDIPTARPIKAQCRLVTPLSIIS